MRISRLAYLCLFAFAGLLCLASCLQPMTTTDRTAEKFAAWCRTHPKECSDIDSAFQVKRNERPTPRSPR